MKMIAIVKNIKERVALLACEENDLSMGANHDSVLHSKFGVNFASLLKEMKINKSVGLFIANYHLLNDGFLFLEKNDHPEKIRRVDDTRIPCLRASVKPDSCEFERLWCYAPEFFVNLVCGIENAHERMCIDDNLFANEVMKRICSSQERGCLSQELGNSVQASAVYSVVDKMTSIGTVVKSTVIPANSIQFNSESVEQSNRDSDDYLTLCRKRRVVESKTVLVHSKRFAPRYNPVKDGARFAGSAGQANVRAVFSLLRDIMLELGVDAIPLVDLARLIGVCPRILNHFRYSYGTDLGNDIRFELKNCRVLHSDGLLGATKQTWVTCLHKDTCTAVSASFTARNIALHEWIATRISSSISGVTSGQVRIVCAFHPKRTAKVFNRYSTLFGHAYSRYQEGKTVCYKLIPPRSVMEQSATDVQKGEKVGTTPTDGDNLSDRQRQNRDLLLRILKQGSATLSVLHAALRQHQIESQKGMKGTTRIDKRTTERLLTRMQREGRVQMLHKDDAEDTFVSLGLDQSDDTIRCAQQIMSETQQNYELDARDENQSNINKSNIEEDTLRRKIRTIISTISDDEASQEFDQLPRSLLDDFHHTEGFKPCGTVISCMYLHFHLVQTVRSRIRGKEERGMLQPIHIVPATATKNIPAAFFLRCLNHKCCEHLQLLADWQLPDILDALATGASMASMKEIETRLSLNLFQELWNSGKSEFAFMIIQLVAVGVLKVVDFDRFNGAIMSNSQTDPILRRTLIDTLNEVSYFKTLQFAGVHAANVTQMMYFSAICSLCRFGASKENFPLLDDSSFCDTLLHHAFQLCVIPHGSWTQVWNQKDVFGHWQFVILPSLGQWCWTDCPPSAKISDAAAFVISQERYDGEQYVMTDALSIAEKHAPEMAKLRERNPLYPWLQNKEKLDWRLLECDSFKTKATFPSVSSVECNRTVRSAQNYYTEVSRAAKRKGRPENPDSQTKKRPVICRVSSKNGGTLNITEDTAASDGNDRCSVNEEMESMMCGRYDLCRTYSAKDPEATSAPNRGYRHYSTVSLEQRWIVYSQFLYFFLVKIGKYLGAKGADLVHPAMNKVYFPPKQDKFLARVVDSCLEIAWMDISFKHVLSRINFNVYFKGEELHIPLTRFRMRLIRPILRDDESCPRNILAWILCSSSGIPADSPLLQHVNHALSHSRRSRNESFNSLSSALRPVVNLMFMKYFSDDEFQCKEASKLLRKYPVHMVKAVYNELHARGWVTKTLRPIPESMTQHLGRSNEEFTLTKDFWALFQDVLAAPLFLNLQNIVGAARPVSKKILRRILSSCGENVPTISLLLLCYMWINHPYAITAEVTVHRYSCHTSNVSENQNTFDISTDRNTTKSSNTVTNLSMDSAPPFNRKYVHDASISISSHAMDREGEIDEETPGIVQKDQASCVLLAEELAPWETLEGEIDEKVLLSFSTKVVATLADCPGSLVEWIQNALWILNRSQTERLLIIMEKRQIIKSKCSTISRKLQDPFTPCASSKLQRVYFVAPLKVK